MHIREHSFTQRLFNMAWLVLILLKWAVLPHLGSVEPFVVLHSAECSRYNCRSSHHACKMRRVAFTDTLLESCSFGYVCADSKATPLDGDVIFMGPKNDERSHDRWSIRVSHCDFCCCLDCTKPLGCLESLSQAKSGSVYLVLSGTLPVVCHVTSDAHHTMFRIGGS